MDRFRTLDSYGPIIKQITPYNHGELATTMNFFDGSETDNFELQKRGFGPIISITPYNHGELAMTMTGIF